MEDENVVCVDVRINKAFLVVPCYGKEDVLQTLARLFWGGEGGEKVQRWYKRNWSIKPKDVKRTYETGVLNGGHPLCRWYWRGGEERVL